MKKISKCMQASRSDEKKKKEKNKKFNTSRPAFAYINKFYRGWAALGWTSSSKFFSINFVINADNFYGLPPHSHDP